MASASGVTNSPTASWIHSPLNAAPAAPGSDETEEDGEEQDADLEEVIEDEDREGWDADEGRAEVESEDVDEEP